MSGEPGLNALVSNWRGGVIGIAIFLLVWVVVFVIAFMAAFGNDSPAARAILNAAGAFFVVANPLWGIPAAYGAGAVLLVVGGKNRDGD